MPRISLLDTYYSDFLDNYPFDTKDCYEEALKKLLYESFGTGDFYSLNLRKLGWECQDIIVNSTYLRSAYGGTLYDQIEAFKPDIIFCQALGLIEHEPDIKRYLNEHPGTLLAGQCSCPVNRSHIPHYNVLFTSFPHYIPLFTHYGVRAVYNTLAFEPEVLRRVESRYGFYGGHGAPPRPYDITFVGGVGAPSHWSSGMQFLEAVAKEFPDHVRFYGYGYKQIPMVSPILSCYRGPAWGLHMYHIYLRSKIVINRHGEVAGEYANNMRMYEATGCGALLLTEAKTNLHHLFDTEREVEPYQSISHAIERLHYYLDHDGERIRIADNGQAKTISSHTYRQRMETISDVLGEML